MNYLSIFLIVSLLGTLVWLLCFKFVFTKRIIVNFVRELGVGLRRIPRTVKELKRKSFHLLGLLVPAIYYFGLRYIPFFTQTTASWILGVIVVLYWIAEGLRRVSPSFAAGFLKVFGFFGILRAQETTAVTGFAFYMTGSFLVITLFHPLIAITSILYLIFGDLIAALVGISFGRVKIPGTKKSLEGSLAMLVICVLVGLFMFHSVPLSEYLAFVGALVATLVELHPPFGIDDNLSIPFLSGLALYGASLRLGSQLVLP